MKRSHACSAGGEVKLVEGRGPRRERHEPRVELHAFGDEIGNRMSQDLLGSSSVKKCLERFLGRLLAVEARVGEEGLTRGKLREREVVVGLSQPPTSLGSCVRLHR